MPSHRRVPVRGFQAYTAAANLGDEAPAEFEPRTEKTWSLMWSPYVGQCLRESQRQGQSA